VTTLPSSPDITVFVRLLATQGPHER
jgi:hypothetical protein